MTVNRFNAYPTLLLGGKSCPEPESEQKEGLDKEAAVATAGDARRRKEREFFGLLLGICIGCQPHRLSELSKVDHSYLVNSAEFPLTIPFLIPLFFSFPL